MTTEDDKKTARAKVSDGIKQGIGVLSAFRDALEETINEARERGDLSPERAREVMKSALERAQEAAEGAKERLDFAPQSQVDDLADQVSKLSARVAALEAEHRAADAHPDASATGSE